MIFKRLPAPIPVKPGVSVETQRRKFLTYQKTKLRHFLPVPDSVSVSVFVSVSVPVPDSVSVSVFVSRTCLFSGDGSGSVAARLMSLNRGFVFFYPRGS